MLFVNAGGPKLFLQGRIREGICIRSDNVSLYLYCMFLFCFFLCLLPPPPPPPPPHTPRYGQMTAGSYCYIGPQGIVHGTTVSKLAISKNDREKDERREKERRRGREIETIMSLFTFADSAHCNERRSQVPLLE